MNVLFLPSWYPSHRDEVLGTFAREHAKAAAIRNDVRVVYLFHDEDADAPLVQCLQPRLTEILSPYRLRHPRLFHVAYFRAWLRALSCLPSGWRPDVIHAYVGFPAALAARVASLRWRAPVVYTEQAGPLAEKILGSRTARWLVPWLAKRSVAVLPCSKFLAADMRELGIAGESVTIVPNCVDTKIFRALSPRKSDRVIRLLTASYLVEGKGIEYAIEAVRLLTTTGTEVLLRVVGDGPLRSALEELAVEKGVGSSVVFDGAMPKVALAEAMRASDVFLMPSERETFSVVVIEAMASGLPVVATKCGGPQELVVNGTGLLVSVGDAEALARGISSIVASPEEFAAGPAHVSGNFSMAVVAEQLHHIYEAAARS